MELFTVYIDRLREGLTERVNEVADPAFLDVCEKELSFPNPVSVAGEIYLAEQHLIIHLRARTEVRIPCAVCNEPFLHPLDATVDDALSLDEISDPVYQYAPLIRESLLLQVPSFGECQGGCCPERSVIAPYLKKTSPTANAHVQFPFSQLD